MTCRSFNCQSIYRVQPVLSLNSSLFWPVTGCDWSKGGSRSMCGSGIVGITRRGMERIFNQGRCYLYKTTLTCATVYCLVCILLLHDRKVDVLSAWAQKSLWHHSTDPCPPMISDTTASQTLVVLKKSLGDLR